eukprot:scaffold209644_cov34-Tisochrysis_lutea.AAC.2
MLAGVSRSSVAAAHCIRAERIPYRLGASSVCSKLRADANARAASRSDARSVSISATTCTSRRAHESAPRSSDTSCEPTGVPGLRKRLATSDSSSTADTRSFNLNPSRPGTKNAPPFSTAAEGRA